MTLNKKVVALSALLVAVLVGCGGFVYTTVGGTVKGLTSTGSYLVLVNGAGYTQSLSADGSFSFRVASNGAYSITVGQQPNPVNCTVTNGSGTMTSEAPVTNIAVNCVPNVPVAGSLTGLTTGQTLTLSLNNVAQTALTADGVFSFQTYVVNNKEYVAKVAIPPVGQVCKIQNATGTAVLSNPPSNIAVSCAAGIPVGGTLSGLKSGTYVILSNTLPDGTTDSRTLLADGVYTFNFSLSDGENYDVQVTTQPLGQKCTVANGKAKASILTPAPASSIAVTCVAA
ncbi:hypothetical protein [Undibacterium fentianense]|uniref:Uncharacterized protein n=1 Tax=Undibacterium fentianense TaxID=2828728 RepID=A0A941E468_9BURK|nr:hypothetical protein [Undibacterium fentianense]MBR7800279.1 hypothetical protein [Undibacterium fentianense]